MLSYSQAFYELKNRLQLLYEEREAAAIAHEIVGFITKLDKTQRLLQKETLFTEEQQRQYERMSRELQTGKPLQYVISTAWFLGREFFVNENVLIPRPETEELVGFLVESRKSKVVSPREVVSETSSQFQIPNSLFRILDIGTGSGCIPVSIKLALPDAEVTSCDISKEAITVAQRNARDLHAAVQFLQLDFLDSSQHNKLGVYDVIVSNPPYIPAEEKARLHRNVKDFEPEIALFVPDNDALVFYKAIALFGKEHLMSNGYIYCELDAGHAEECKFMFEEMGYKNVEIRKDMNGNWRMLRAGS